MISKREKVKEKPTEFSTPACSCWAVKSETDTSNGDDNHKLLAHEQG